MVTRLAGPNCPEFAPMFSTWTSAQKRTLVVFGALWIAAIAFVAARGLF